MADQAEQVSTSGLVDAKQQPGLTKRRQYSEALKRQIVAETQAPGALVSIVARRHHVNSHQLFRWRRQLCNALFGPCLQARKKVEQFSPLAAYSRVLGHLLPP